MFRSQGLEFDGIENHLKKCTSETGCPGVVPSTPPIEITFTGTAGKKVLAPRRIGTDGNYCETPSSRCPIRIRFFIRPSCAGASCAKATHLTWRWVVQQDVKLKKGFNFKDYVKEGEIEIKDIRSRCNAGDSRDAFGRPQLLTGYDDKGRPICYQMNYNMCVEKDPVDGNYVFGIMRGIAPDGAPICSSFPKVWDLDNICFGSMCNNFGYPECPTNVSQGDTCNLPLNQACVTRSGNLPTEKHVIPIPGAFFASVRSQTCMKGIPPAGVTNCATTCDRSISSDGVCTVNKSSNCGYNCGEAQLPVGFRQAGIDIRYGYVFRCKREANGVD